MTDQGLTLLLLGLSTAFLPIQVVVTILMLRSTGGVATAAAWIGGMTVVRLAQYAVVGLILDRAMENAGAEASILEGAFLLLVAILLLVSAAKKAFADVDDDAPPPRWMAVVTTVTPRRALLMGAGVVALSPKLWALTIGAIGAIAELDPAPLNGWLLFLGWVVLAQSVHMLLLAGVVLSPSRAAPMLVRAGSWLELRSRPLVVGISLVFGIWFLLKALGSFGFGLTI